MEKDEGLRDGRMDGLKEGRLIMQGCSEGVLGRTEVPECEWNAPVTLFGAKNGSKQNESVKPVMTYIVQ